MPEIPYSIRDKHVHIIGVTGAGKSTLISWWAYNDIISREGAVCVIDPKGDLVDTIMRYIPDDRLDDVIYTDISDPLPLDFMNCVPGEEDSVVADLKFILMGGEIDPATMPTINDNIEALLYTLIDANRHPDLNTQEGRAERCTFLDLAEFFEDKDRRDFILKHLSNPKNQKFWAKMPNDNDTAKILTRIRPFTRSATLSKIMGHPTPALDIHKVIREKKILLVRLPVTNRSSPKYGSLLMAKIQHAAFSRHDIPEHRRIPLFLYVDEFQHFQGSEDFHNVVDMGRGYKLCLTLSITRLQPLTENMKSALGIVQTFIIFQIFAGDANYYRQIIDRHDPNQHLRDKLETIRLDSRLSPTDERGDRIREKYAAIQGIVSNLPDPLVATEDAIDLPEFHAIYKVGKARPVIEPTPTPGSKNVTPDQLRKIEYIKEHSKKFYGTPAERGQKRSGDKPPCDSPPVLHTEVNATRNTDPTPSGPPNIPPYESKKRKP